MHSYHYIKYLLLSVVLAVCILAVDDMLAPSVVDAGVADCPGNQDQAVAAPRGGQQGQAFSPEQKEKYNTIVEEYAKRINAVRDEIFVRRQELRALHNNATPDVKAVRDCATGLATLKRQMEEAHNDMMRRLEEAGIVGGGMGMGYGRYSFAAHHAAQGIRSGCCE
ncbi:MAG: periplasmic heavy metal sensor [Desulfovibrio sp.]|jgi:hypothetical protein|nr:periplasmic heavy metal sensor [Desulfovibrio sp.]